MSVLHVTKENFEQEILQAEKPVLIDFWATWCGPCMMMGPIVEDYAVAHPEYVVAKVDVDQQGELAAAFGIVSIPTVKVFRGGQLSASVVGLRPKEELAALLD